MAVVGKRRKTNLNLPPRVYIKHGAYYFVHITGKWQRLAKVGEESEMRRAWAVLDDPQIESGKVKALINDYLVKYAKANKADRTYKDNCTEAEYLIAFFGDMIPHEVQPRHVGQYLDINAVQRPVRANREKALLSHVFTWAMRQPKWGTMITMNPCRGVHRNTETPRIRLISDAEYMSVYNLAHKSVQRLMTLMYRTLQRPSDILKLGPRNIIKKNIDGIERKILSFKQSKTGNLIEIIVNDEMEEAIKPTGNVIYPTFIHTNEGEKYSYSGINAMFRRVMDTQRIKIEKETGIKPEPFGIYDIKGKGATDMYRDNVPMQHIQLLAGHDSITTTEIYIKSRLLDPVAANQRKIAQ